MGTVNVLEAARACPSRPRGRHRDERQGLREPRDRPRRSVETDPMGGRDPYGASKGAAELVTAAYRESFFADGAGGRVASAPATSSAAATGRPTGSSRTAVRALVAGEPIVVRNPDAVRPWQHVLEPLSGYLRLGALAARRRPPLRRAWNFGPTDRAVERPVRWVVERFLERVGLRLVDDAGQRPTASPTRRTPEPRQHARRASSSAGRRSGTRRRPCAGPPPGTASTTGPRPAPASWSTISSRRTRTTPARRACLGRPSASGRPGDGPARRRGRHARRDPRAGRPLLPRAPRPAAVRSRPRPRALRRPRVRRGGDAARSSTRASTST